MKVAIVGGGFLGLSAGVELANKGHEVAIYESSKQLGGLATGFLAAGWEWPLERFYHHVFSNDNSFLEMARMVGENVTFKNPVTKCFINGKSYRLDSAMSVLKFGPLGILDRLRMGAGLGILKLIRNGVFFEHFAACELLPKIMGKPAYDKIWKPLLVAKFGKYYKNVNMAWFWARVYKRTADLGYPEGGFVALAAKMGTYIKNKGGKIVLNKKITEIKADFDKIIITTPAPTVDLIIGKNKIDWPKIDYLWAQTLVLELSESLLDCYWMNILEKDWPFLVAVEHTNFADKSHYNGKVIVYLGNYLAEDDRRLDKDKERLIDDYLPYLKKIKPSFNKKQILRSWLFKSPYAQPVFPVNYSQLIPGGQVDDRTIVTNMSMVYPWDRGTNYAVETGKHIVKTMIDQYNLT